MGANRDRVSFGGTSAFLRKLKVILLVTLTNSECVAPGGGSSDLFLERHVHGPPRSTAAWDIKHYYILCDMRLSGSVELGGIMHATTPT